MCANVATTARQMHTSSDDNALALAVAAHVVVVVDIVVAGVSVWLLLLVHTKY